MPQPLKQADLLPCPVCAKAVAVKTFPVDVDHRRVVIIHVEPSACDGIDPQYDHTVTAKQNNDIDRQALGNQWNAGQRRDGPRS